jgi:hypothetical protein
LALVCFEKGEDGPSTLKESGKATNFLERRLGEVRHGYWLRSARDPETRATQKPGRRDV